MPGDNTKYTPRSGNKNGSRKSYAGRSDRSDNSVNSGHSERSDRPQTPDRSDRSGQSNRPSRPYRPARPGEHPFSKSERPDRDNRQDRQERSERPDRPARSRNDRPGYNRNDGEKRYERKPEEHRESYDRKDSFAAHSAFKNQRNYTDKPDQVAHGEKRTPIIKKDNQANNQENDNAGIIISGVNAVLEILAADPSRVESVFIRKGKHDSRTDKILDLCREQGVRFLLADEAVMEKQMLAGKDGHRGKEHLLKGSQGVLARLYAAGFIDLEELFKKAIEAPLPLIVALDQVQDPGNAGTLARTLYAMGGAGLIVPRHNGVYLGAAASKAAAGALEKLPVARVTNLSQALDNAEEEGFTIYGAAAAHAKADPESKNIKIENVFTLKPQLPAILVLGSEESGIRPGVAKRCHSLLNIPMRRHFDSLNVAQAAAIIIAAFSATTE